MSASSAKPAKSKPVKFKPVKSKPAKCRPGRPLSPEPVVVARLRLNRFGGSRRSAAPVRRWIRAAVRLEYGATAVRELRRVLPQAGHDTVLVWDLIAAEPPDVGRAGHLLLHRPAMFLREGGRRDCDRASQYAHEESC